MTPPAAPVLPDGYRYTPYYCEENIYLLAASFQLDSSIVQAWEISVVFVSNGSKLVALWNQKLCTGPEHPVIWDYHVILALRPRRATGDDIGDIAWVYDFDSNLAPIPQPWHDYLYATFGGELTQRSLPEQYRRCTIKSLCHRVCP
ncbi:hypothetical protein M422DRAFT_36601 [Sphaerobolus stellatus SS14]|uniref:Protein N-terminal glutamine amidohydrolase n=1 Tax=Sphaerobolus stellatus (strain SS14) TaxID=990650 RepID=A0A0C9UN64_SPHS4|nr:hypothetical protein M422DRAFT_36601 [Sphaerobolus stellatus SS14]